VPVLKVIPALFGVFFVTAVVLLIVYAVAAVRRERRRREQLRGYAARLGWLPITGPVPEPVAKDARSRRCRLALGLRRGGHDLWVVWHQWTESTGSGEGSSSRTRNRTRYFLWLGPAYPDIAVRRRTGIGAFFKPVRGIGTGDAGFDKAFLVRPSDTYEQRRLLTPPLREAMLARRLPVWEIAGGVLITAYEDMPRIENLQARADAISYLARALG
jgi:hypothetical protein